MSPDDSDSIARYRNPDLWVQDLDPREMLALSALSGFLSDRIHNHKRLLTFQIHCLRWLVTQWQRIKIQELSCYSDIAQIETQVKVVSLVCVKISKLSLGWEHCFVRCPKHSPECRGAPYDWQTTHLCNMGSIFPKATTEKKQEKWWTENKQNQHMIYSSDKIQMGAFTTSDSGLFFHDAQETKQNVQQFWPFFANKTVMDKYNQMKPYLWCSQKNTVNISKLLKYPEIIFELPTSCIHPRFSPSRCCR